MNITASINPSKSPWANDWSIEWKNRQKDRIQRTIQRHQRDRKYFGTKLLRSTGSNLLQIETDSEQLRKLSLPILENEQALADFLQITLGQLRWFTYDKEMDTVWHYRKYIIKKHNGTERVILAPKDRLKKIQRFILDEILYKLVVAEEAHGFVPRRSTVTNAQRHIGQDVVINIDLSDFFSTITYSRVRGFFLALGFSFSVASTLALLCTECEREKVEDEGKIYFRQTSERYLVQGAPTSPALANLIARRLDARLRGLAQRRGFTYTRYADDLTFSGNFALDAATIIGAVTRIAQNEGFVVHTDKTRILRRVNRQTVTGFVVNEVLSTPREIRRRLRAILHNASKTDLQSQNRDARSNFAAYIVGMIGYIASANPQQAQQLYEAFRQVLKK